ncbi:MAG: prepilin-type N-terminal cleavage/methylation domain-containing protein [Pseudolysinimonas sp.]
MRKARRQPSAAGFSLIEAMIAAAIFLVIAIGILPLFVRSMTNNATGAELIQKVTQSRSRVDEFVQLPFNSPRLVWNSGATQLQSTSYYTRGSATAPLGSDPNTGWAADTWTPNTSRGQITLERVTTIQQWQLSTLQTWALQDDGSLPSSPQTSPLAGNENIDYIQLKAVRSQMRNPKLGSLGNGPLDTADDSDFITFKSR